MISLNEDKETQNRGNKFQKKRINAANVNKKQMISFQQKAILVLL